MLCGAKDDSTYAVSAGAAFLVYGASGGIPNTDPSTTDVKFHGEEANDVAGVSVSIPGDVNNDGYLDILVGADKSLTIGKTGAAYLIFGDAAW